MSPAFCAGRTPQDQHIGCGTGLELADVLRLFLPDFARNNSIPKDHWRVLNAITGCRTAAMGAHLFACTACGARHYQFHSCRNRHCPKCQDSNRQQWLAKQQADLLPVPYFHVVFTLPHDLNPLVQQNRKALYDLLFSAVSQTLLEFAANRLGAQIGVTAVLHTWSQSLLDHYHLHCIVTGGGLSPDGKRWIGSDPNYFLPVRALSQVFSGKFRHGLRELFEAGQLQFHGQLESLAKPSAFQQLIRLVSAKPWVVYCKPPFAGPEQVLGYLGRYTHRVAITNERILAIDQQQSTVTFIYKDYADHGRRKRLTLQSDEFIRRFLLHVLPRGFVKIRHYGLLANNSRKTKIAQARQILGECPPAVLTADIAAPQQHLCPRCQQPTLECIAILTAVAIRTLAPHAGALDSS